MLRELRVEGLGIIDELSVLLDAGMTALTGETGAGKTLVVEAIELLVGGRADVTLVREGAAEARVEGRFVVGDEEHVLARVIPRDGRSRAYVDGRLATVGQLAELGAALVDLHGQHAHQSLLGVAAQREARDRFGGVDLAPLAAARARVAELDAELAKVGGDARVRAREADLLRYQVDEIDAAAVEDSDEEARLEEEEDRLAGALAHREAAAVAAEALRGDGGALDALGTVIAQLSGRVPLAALGERARSLAAELDDLAAEVRHAAESLEDDPERLAEVRARRQRLRDLRRKYGESLAEVLAFRDEAAARLAELESSEARAAGLETERARALEAVAAAAAEVGARRRAAAPELAKAVEARLAALAMPRARLAVEVGDVDPGDEVTFLIDANGEGTALPLARVASGGELARVMLALRLVLTQAPPTLVFDEVDAGIGGSAALAVGAALGEVARHHQVLVVTHLPQVAAYADVQCAIAKRERRGRVTTTVERLDDAARVVELSRMLSGLTASDSGRQHAEELLAAARASRGSPPGPR